MVVAPVVALDWPRGHSKLIACEKPTNSCFGNLFERERNKIFELRPMLIKSDPVVEWLRCL